jgi:sodium-dependent dicarboxylate transporter 2/3/5
MGGFFIALTIEKWNLHRRIALATIRAIGDRPRRILLGFMLASAFLSMWISNTATALMMLPIALSVVTQLGGEGDPDRVRRFGLVLLLAIAYSCSIGGTATLVGTPPNIVFAQIYHETFPDAPPVTFLDWMLRALPFAAVFLAFTWAYLAFVVGRLGARSMTGGRDAIREQYAALGPMSRQEKMVLGAFVATALLWIFRRDIGIASFTIPGWESILGVGGYVSDATVAIGMSVLLFLTPVDLERGEFLLDWKTAVRIPWGILLLFGGGFALAGGFQETGLSRWIGETLTRFEGVPAWVLVVAICTLMTFLTELTSNTATTQMVLPILAATAVTFDCDPLLLMVPATLSASCAFMLPVATPPNAIVFSSDLVPIPTMARVGLVMNVAGVLLIFSLFHLLG